MAINLCSEFILNLMSTQSLENILRGRIAEHGVCRKVGQLCLDEIDLNNLEGVVPLLGRCVRVKYLSICDCGLLDLSMLPVLPNLQML